GLESFTKDGTLLAYGLAQSGSDHSEIHVRDTATGMDLRDIIPPARQGGVEWKHDNSGFYYAKLPKTSEHGRNEQAYDDKLYFHKLGTKAEMDRLIYERPEDRELSFGVTITEDGKFELLHLSRGTKRENRLYWRPANAAIDSDWNKLIDTEDFVYQPIGDDGSILYVRTTEAAPRGRIIGIDLSNSDKKNWQKEIIPQGEDVLAGVDMVGDKFIVTYMRDAHELLKIFNK